MVSSGAATRQELVYSLLRSDIVAGRIEPGSKLRFDFLCSTYGVSVGVVREVLARLVEQDLVVVAPQQGYAVKSLSVADMINLCDVMREVETLALRKAIANGDVQWESEVLAAHHRLASEEKLDPTSPNGLSDAWVLRHQEFHEVLLTGCNNPRLTLTATRLRSSAELYRQWTTLASGGRDVVAEHRAITDAVVARNIDVAVSLLDEHIALTTGLILEERPELVANGMTGDMILPA